MRHHHMIWLGGAAALLLSCQESGPVAAANTTNATATAEAKAPAAPAAEQARTGPLLRLAGGGLQSGEPNLHPSATYNFGIPRAEAVAAVAAIRGPATAEDSNDECGAGPMQFTHFGPLTLNFQQGRFVGWSLSGPASDPPITTEFDLGIGTTRAELDGNDEPPVVEQSTLGTEFTVDEISGLLSGTAPTATVTHLWAGTDCAFR